MEDQLPQDIPEDDLIPELKEQLKLGQHTEEKKEEIKAHDSQITAERGTQEWADQICELFKGKNNSGEAIQELALPSFETVHEHIPAFER